MPTGAYKRTPEMNQRMSESLKKRRLSEEHKRKIGNAHRGRIVSLETRKKISASLKGKGHQHTIASRINIGKAQRGELHWNWQGGKTEKNKGLREAIRQLPEYKQWRELIFIRDNYSCVQCKKRGSLTLNADHITPLTKIILDLNIDNIEKALKCSELWDINNGRTLCIDCHKTTDTYAGHTGTLKLKPLPNEAEAA